VSGSVIAGPTLMNGVAKPVSVYTIDWPSVPIVAFADVSSGPAMLIVPGPTNISFHRFDALPREYVRLSEGTTFAPAAISSPTTSLSVYATPPSSTRTLPTAGPVRLEPYCLIIL